LHLWSIGFAGGGLQLCLCWTVASGEGFILDTFVEHWLQSRTQRTLSRSIGQGEGFLPTSVNIGFTGGLLGILSYRFSIREHIGL